MPRLTPNLHFAGECAQAMALYERAFGAHTKVCLRYADADPSDWEVPLTEAQRAYVYHAEMELCGHRIILSDEIERREAGHIPVSLLLAFDTPDEVRRSYALLEEGAHIVHAMTDTTYSSAFVSLIDRFGVRWELMTEDR